MGAGARRRADRRRREDADELRSDAMWWSEYADELYGPQRGRSAEAQSDGDWARKIAQGAMRQADLLDLTPASLRSLSRFVATRTAVDRAIEGLVARLRAQGVTWEQIGAELGITRQAAQKRYARPAETSTS